MTESYFWYIAPLIVSNIIFVWLLHAAWVHRKEAVARLFGIAIICALLWATFYIFEIIAQTKDLKIFFANLQFFGIIPLPALWFYLVALELGKTQQFRKFIPVFVFFIILDFVILWTNGFHHLFRVDPQLYTTPGGVLLLDADYGPWNYFAHVPYMLIMFVVSGVYLIISLRHVQKLYRMRYIIMIISCFVPLLISLPYIFGIDFFHNFNPATTLFSISGILLGIAIFRFRMFDITPIARARLFDSITDPIIVTDPDLLIVDYNKAAVTLFIADSDYSAKKSNHIVGRDITRLFSQNTSLIEHIKKPSLDPTEVSVYAPLNNAERYFTLHIIPINDGQMRSQAKILHFHEITQLKQLEQQFQHSQKMDSIGRLAGGVAHEFNNLITTITGNIELALSHPTGNPELRLRLKEIRSSAERASALTNELLAFSRKQVTSPQIINLNNALTDIITLLNRILGETVRCELDLDPAIKSVLLDSSQFEQVITNLVINAREAMPGGGTISIETKNIDFHDDFAINHPNAEPGQYVLVSVSDTGSGIEKSIREHIFEPFFSTKENSEGSGLGLSMCYGIVTQNKGFIDIDSEPGKGTTVYVYFPALSEPAIREAETERESVDLHGTETILVAEDEAGLLEIVTEILEMYNYNVIHTSNGMEALDKVRQSDITPDLLLTDVIMPTINGKELSDKLSEMFPAMKVLYMSGYTEDIIAHYGVLDNELNFIAKPFNPETLLFKVRLLLDS